MRLPRWLLPLALAATASASHVVPFRIHKQRTSGLPLRRRGVPFDEDLANNLTSGAYFAQVELGTPGQTLSLHVDTGSTDVWVLSPQTNLCRSSALQSVHGNCVSTFDSSASSTFREVEDADFEIRYLDGSGAEGIYFTDNVNVGGLNVTGVQMGLARKSTSSWGMLGVGYAKNSAARKPYPSIMDNMFDQGLINIKAYSLYLNDLEASTGTILFGGIDTEKFYGELKTVKTLPNDNVGHVTHFNVSLTSLTTVSATTEPEEFLISPVPVILDSGTTLTYLPRTVTGPLFDKINAYDRSSATIPIVFVDCALRTSDPSLVFAYRFGSDDGPVVKVSISDIVFDDVKAYVSAGIITLPSNLPFPRDRVCSFGILTSQGGEVHLLGDTFLRSAYVVYDLTNDQISLAQSNMNSTKENIIEIPKGATAIPSVTGQAVPISTLESQHPNSGTRSRPSFPTALLTCLGVSVFVATVQ
ncbi:putative aspartic-type endopeptidase opsB [Echria macrotheca]|uniref:Aspartic-type endopeptidase opsB n=1 Tax=Echria macrotheca TaxID=438768 RepID=A0AAJ0B8F3_9PEZI|nr:putative aspartic-type endopeptidase opsB [Echria macrotheca]